MTKYPRSPDGRSAQGDLPASSAALDTVILVSEVAAIAEDEVGTGLARIGISFSDLRLLMLIGRQGDLGISRAALARARRLPVSQSVREVRPLEKLGWVLRTNDGNFRLTASGHGLVIEGAEIASEISALWITRTTDQTAALRRPLIELMHRVDA